MSRPRIRIFLQESIRTFQKESRRNGQDTVVDSSGDFTKSMTALKISMLGKRRIKLTSRQMGTVIFVNSVAAPFGRRISEQCNGLQCVKASSKVVAVVSKNNVMIV